jgi:tripartite-type tricarboxylate transporter receptor subunit TctC
LPDLIAGTASQHVRQHSGVDAAGEIRKLRVLAVASSKRISLLPDVPTVAEAGVRF